MILEDETKEAFGYYPRDLKPQSRKCILAACDECGKVRKTSKNQYHGLCGSCAAKGRTYTEEIRANMCTARKGIIFTEEHKEHISIALKGKTNALGYKHTKEAIAKMSGKNNYAYKGGKKVARARARAKYRKLGHTLLMPLAEGEAGHHITNEYVMGIPADVHNSIGGSRKKHRTLVLQWLKANDKKKYLKVLCVLAEEYSK